MEHTVYHLIISCQINSYFLPRIDSSNESHTIRGDVKNAIVLGGIGPDHYKNTFFAPIKKPPKRVKIQKNMCFLPLSKSCQRKAFKLTTLNNFKGVIGKMFSLESDQ